MFIFWNILLLEKKNIDITLLKSRGTIYLLMSSVLNQLHSSIGYLFCSTCPTYALN